MSLSLKGKLYDGQWNKDNRTGHWMECVREIQLDRLRNHEFSWLVIDHQSTMWWSYPSSKVRQERYVQSHTDFPLKPGFLKWSSTSNQHISICVLFSVINLWFVKFIHIHTLHSCYFHSFENWYFIPYVANAVYQKGEFLFLTNVCPKWNRLPQGNGKRMREATSTTRTTILHFNTLTSTQRFYSWRLSMASMVSVSYD